jgi:hypothetical protein
MDVDIVCEYTLTRGVDTGTLSIYEGGIQLLVRAYCITEIETSPLPLNDDYALPLDYLPHHLS